MPRPRRTLVVLLTALVALVIGACAPPPPPPGPVAVPNAGTTVPLQWGSPPLDRPDLAYGQHAKQVGDLYLPRLGGNRGVIILIHGGGFHSSPSSRADNVTVSGLIMRQTHRGFAVFNITHRGLNDGDVFPAQLRDVDRAVRWVRAHGRDVGMNPNTVIVAGGSAGGTLAALSGTAWNSGGPAGRTARPDGWISMAGIMQGIGNQYIRSWLGPNGTNRNWVNAASPVHHLDANDPPGYLIHGDRDNVVGVNQTHQMVARARELGITENLYYDIVNTGPGRCRWHFPACGANAVTLDRWLDRRAAAGTNT